MRVHDAQAPSTDACQDAHQLDIMINISKTPGVAGFTFHGYPGHNGTGADALSSLLRNATWLRTGILTGSSANMCIDAWRQRGPKADGIELLVTEASSSYNWQLPPPAQNSFLHTLFTVAELGQYATTGVGMVARWSFSEGSPFATVWHNDTDDRWEVAADYWLMLAHKATVRGAALTTMSAPNAGPHTPLVYAYCGGASPGSLTISVANPGPASTTVSLSVSSENKTNVDQLARREYVFTAPNGDVASIAPILNGAAVALRLQQDGSLPPGWGPRLRAAGSGALLVPPSSAAYVEIPGANVAACRANA